MHSSTESLDECFSIGFTTEFDIVDGDDWVQVESSMAEVEHDDVAAELARSNSFCIVESSGQLRRVNLEMSPITTSSASPTTERSSGADCGTNSRTNATSGNHKVSSSSSTAVSQNISCGAQDVGPVIIIDTCQHQCDKSSKVGPVAATTAQQAKAQNSDKFISLDETPSAFRQPTTLTAKQRSSPPLVPPRPDGLVKELFPVLYNEDGSDSRAHASATLPAFKTRRPWPRGRGNSTGSSSSCTSSSSGSMNECCAMAVRVQVRELVICIQLPPACTVQVAWVLAEALREYARRDLDRQSKPYRKTLSSHNNRSKGKRHPLPSQRALGICLRRRDGTLGRSTLDLAEDARACIGPGDTVVVVAKSMGASRRHLGPLLDQQRPPWLLAMQQVLGL